MVLFEKEHEAGDIRSKERISDKMKRWSTKVGIHAGC